jgi:diguanylate cyclase (GGDEF)-like protein
MVRARTSNLRDIFGAGAPWRIMAPLAVVHALMLASAALGLHSIAREVDHSDALRAKEAVGAAYNYQLSRLEMVTVNNAVYTEAWKAVGGDRVNVAWAIENWTVAPVNLPGHHGILLVDADGQPIIGTRAGRRMSRAAMLGMAAVVRPVVHKLSRSGEASAKGLISTGSTPMLVAAANVMPEPADRTPTSVLGPKRRLVLIHPLNANLLSTMNETIGGEQLKLSSPNQSANRILLSVDAGTPVTLSWRSREPGRGAMSRSLRIVVPVLLLVTALLVLAMKAGLTSSRALKRAATTDPLTELPNRAAFSAELERRLVRGRRLALGLIDLDGFKQVNDQHGHAAGDDLLKRFGELLKQVADPSDMIARLGGDEFAFLCEDRGAADRLAIRLGLTLSHPLDVGSCTLKVEASIGISLAEPGHSMRDVMVDADARLYIDKRRRRAERNLGTAWAVPAALSPPGARLSA